MILIDTHVWIWIHSSSARLSAAARERLLSEDRVALSVLSVYETMVAVERRRISTTLSADALVRSWLRAAPFPRIPVTEDAVMLSGSLPFQHSDPLDRMIAATALYENLPLMTSDQQLLSLPWLPTIPAT